MKILNLMQGTNLGGTERVSLTLMEELCSNGHTCQVLSLTPLGSLAPLLEQADIPCAGLPYRGKGGWRSFSALRRALRQYQGDALLMTGHNLLAFLTLDSSVAKNRVLAQHFHHTGVKPNWQWRLIYALACRRFRAITFPSAFIRDEAVRLYPPVAPLARVIPNPVPLPPLVSPEEHRQARERLGIEPHRQVVGNAGWLIPRKRFDLFLTVARRVADYNPDALFIIAGDGPERGRLEKQAAALGINTQVRWLGWQDDLVDFYRSLDLLLFNSDWDAMGMTPLEAMSFGVPVVASVLHGGLGEILRHERDGYLFPAHDVELLAQTVTGLLEDPNRRQRLGHAGRERISRSANPASCCSAYERLLGPQL